MAERYLREWLREQVAPILQSTLFQISRFNVDTLSKRDILPPLYDYILFFLSDIIRRDEPVNVIPEVIINKILHNDVIDDKQFLEFHWLRTFIVPTNYGSFY